MERRTLIKTVGSIGALGAAGYAFAGSAAAEVQTGMFGVQQNYDIDSESGVLESLTLEDISVVAKWKNFDNYVQEVSWNLDVQKGGGPRQNGVRTAYMNADDGDFDKVFSGKVTSGMDDLDLLGPDTPWDAEDFEVEPESLSNRKDVTKEFDLTFYLVCQVEDVEGEQLEVRVRGDTDLGITNLGAGAEAGGEGTLSHEDSEAPNQTPPSYIKDSWSSSGDAGTLKAEMGGGGWLTIKTANLDQSIQNWDDSEDEVSIWFDGGSGSGTEVKVSGSGASIKNPDNANVNVDGNDIEVDVEAAGYTTFGATASLVVGAQANTVQTNLTANGNKAWESGARYDLTQ